MHATMLSGKMTSSSINSNLGAMGRTFADLAASTGKWETVQKRVNNQTVQLTENLQRQKSTYRDIARARKSGLLELARQDQLRLRQAQVTTLGRTPAGAHYAQLAVPNQVLDGMDGLNRRIGFQSALLKSASTQMVNFGKNTQWAGRQLMVGFTLPLMAAGAATGYFAFQADKALTRIAKVYDTTINDNLSLQDQAIDKERQISQLRIDGMTTAKNAAKAYGASMKDTLDTQGELAATGKAGRELQIATNETMRLATLGEIDYQTAVTATVSLQSVFKQSADELTKSFNYMNAVESQTSLSMNDFATAIPIAAAPIQALGGDIQDLGTLLVAMKARGIDAAEGANAIKSAFNRLQNPGKAVQEMFKDLTGKDIIKLVDDTNLEIIPTLEALGEATANLGKVDRSRVLGKLFGTFQNTRINAMLTGVTEDMKDASSQVSRAVELADKTDAELAGVADSELNRMQKSASGRLKIAVESIKVDLAQMGQGFLESAVKILQGAENIIEAFRKMPGPLKGFLKWMVIIVAAIGPLAMLTGLFFNMAGTVGKAAGSLGMLLTKYELLNPNSVLAEKAAAAATTAMDRQTKSVDSLATSIALLNDQLLQAARSQKMLEASLNTPAARGGIARRVDQLKGNGAITNPNTGNTSMMIPGADGRARRTNISGDDARIMRNAEYKWRRNGRRPMAPRTIDQAHMEANGVNATKNAAALTRETELQASATKAAGIEENKRRQAVNATRIGAGLLTASLIATLVPINESHSTLNKIKSSFVTTALAAGLLLPVLGNAKRALTAMSTTSGSVGAHFRGSALVKGPKALASNLALAAKGTGTLRSRISGVSKVLASGSGLLNPWVLGLAAAGAAAFLLYKHLSKSSKEIDKMNEDTSGLAKIFGYQELSPGSVVDPKTGEEIKKVSQQVKELKAEYPSLAKNIRDAGNEQAQFNAAAFQGIKAINSGASVDKARAVVKAALTAAYDDVDKAEAMMLKFKFDPQNIEQQIAIASQKIRDGINTSNKFAEGFNPFANKGDSAFKEAAKSFNQVIAGLIESGDASGADKAANAFVDNFNKSLLKAKPFRRFSLAQQMLTSFGEKNGVSDEKINSVLDDIAERFRKGDNKVMLEDLMELDPSKNIATFKKLTAGVDGWKKQVASNKSALPGLSDDKFSLKSQKEAITTMLTGKKLTKDQQTTLRLIAQETGMRLMTEEEIAQVIKRQNNDLAGQTDTQKEVTESRKSLLQGLKAGLKGLDKQSTAESESLDRRQQAQTDSVEASNRRREAAFDRQQQAMENRHAKAQRNFDNKWNARVKKLKDEESLRQRIFDAERNRIQRLAELQNANINFNAALQSGNLDEAARVQNTQRASTESNNLDDLDKNLGTKADKKLDALESQRDKATYKLKRHQDFEKQAFDATKKRYQDSVAAAKDAAQAGFKAEKDALKKSQELRKANLEQAIKAVTDYDAATDGPWSDFLKKLRNKFGNFSGAAGKSLDAAMKTAFEKINERADSFGGSKRWGPRSADAMEQWLNAAGKKVGLTPKELKKFSKNHWSTGYQGGQVKHEGGALSGGNSRRGYPANAATYPSEVNVLAKKSEYMMQTSAHRKYGTRTLDAVNKGNAEILTRHSGGALNLPEGSADAGQIRMEGMTRKWATDLAVRAAQKQSEESRMVTGVSGSLGPVDPRGWNKPWKGSYGTSNGHDYPLSYKTLYAPHAGIVRSHANRGYEPRAAHGGRGFKSYGQWIDFDGGGTNLMFAHLSRLPQKAGSSMKVKAGQAMGVTGDTGNSSGPHVHVERNHSGDNGQFGAFFRSRGISLRKGGQLKYDQDIRAHEGETVLTKKLSERFKEGVSGLASNGNDEYNITVTVPGGSANDADKIAQRVMEKIRFEKSRKGNNR